MDTGCPAQELLVTVIITSGMCSRPFSLSRRSRAVMFMLPLKSFTSEGIRASFTGRSTASAPLNSMLARVVSKWVLLGMTFPLPAHDLEKDFLGGPTLVGGDDVLEAGELLHHFFKSVEAAGAGVGFIAVDQSGPLFCAHGGGAAVGQQVDKTSPRHAG